jgi:hypothetical protein
MPMTPWTRRELHLLRWAMLAARMPLSDPEYAEWRALTEVLGLTTDAEWQALLAKLREAAEEP